MAVTQSAGKALQRPRLLGLGRAQLVKPLQTASHQQPATHFATTKQPSLDSGQDSTHFCLCNRVILHVDERAVGITEVEVLGRKGAAPQQLFIERALRTNRQALKTEAAQRQHSAVTSGSNSGLLGPGPTQPPSTCLPRQRQGHTLLSS